MCEVLFLLSWHSQSMFECRGALYGGHMFSMHCSEFKQEAFLGISWLPNVPPSKAKLLYVSLSFPNKFPFFFLRLFNLAKWKIVQYHPENCLLLSWNTNNLVAAQRGHFDKKKRLIGAQSLSSRFADPASPGGDDQEIAMEEPDGNISDEENTIRWECTILKLHSVCLRW